MRKDGKHLEKIARLIHEALKNSDKTFIHSNYKIANSSGRDREIDILIETKINDFVIKIAIECKDYGKPVSVEKIEAYHSKCLRIPEINKKIFISNAGFQIDAINAAKDFGIELYNIKDIDKSLILNWIPIKQLGLRFQLNDNFFITCTSEEETGKIEIPLSAVVYFYDEGEPENIEGLITNILFQYKRELWGIMMYEFMRRKDAPIDKVHNIPFKISLKGVYLKSEQNKEYPLEEISASIDCWLIEKSPDITESKSYRLNNGNAKANYVSINVGEGEKANFVFTKDKMSIFHGDKNGTIQELGLIGSYDPKTDKFKFEGEEDN